MAAAEAAHVTTLHRDLVHDAAFDYYGQKLATCSADGSIQLFERNDAGEWILVGRCTGHKSAVLRLSWAHPQFGQLLASCSLDNSVCVWEAREAIDDSDGTRVAEWARRASIPSSDSVTAIEFAPHHAGLMLAVGVADGHVRVCGVDERLNISSWATRWEFDPLGRRPVTALAWNPSRFDAPTLVVGGESPDVAVWALSRKLKQWIRLCVLPTACLTVNDVAWAPDAGRSYHLVATACRASAPAATPAASAPVSALAGGTVSLWRLEFREDDDEADPDTEDEEEEDEAAAERRHTAGVESLVDAAVRRQAESAAASSSSSSTSSAAAAAGSGGGQSGDAYKAVDGVRASKECDVCSTAADGVGEVWRVRWGVIGSMLATTGDDGVVRLWRRRLRGDWACAQELDVDTGVAINETSVQATAAAAVAARME